MKHLVCILKWTENFVLLCFDHDSFNQFYCWFGLIDRPIVALDKPYRLCISTIIIMWSSANFQKEISMYKEKKTLTIIIASKTVTKIRRSQKNVIWLDSNACNTCTLILMKFVYKYSITERISHTHIAMKFKRQRVFKCNTKHKWQIIPHFVTVKELMCIIQIYYLSSYLLLCDFFLFILLKKKPTFSHTHVI